MSKKIDWNNATVAGVVGALVTTALGNLDKLPWDSIPTGLRVVGDFFSMEIGIALWQAILIPIFFLIGFVQAYQRFYGPVLTRAKSEAAAEVSEVDRLQSQMLKLNQELLATKAKATIQAAAATTITELQEENSVLKEALAKEKAGNEARLAKPVLVANPVEPEPIVDMDYKEVTLDGVHWRWNYLPPFNQVMNVKAYCDHCDFDLDVGATENRERGLCVACPKCGTLAYVHSNFGNKTVEKATAEIERRIRNGLWRKDLAANKTRAAEILNDAARHSPVMRKA